jgi:hypothetical protein
MSIDMKSIGELFDLLVTADVKCFLAQEKIADKNTSHDDLVTYALLAQAMNKRRTELIRAIDRRLGESENTVTEKTY